MKTMEVYFDVLDQDCVVCLEVDAADYSAEKIQIGLKHMFGAPATAIDKQTYQQLLEKYESSHTELRRKQNGT